MPDWFTFVVALVAGGLILRLMMVWIDRTPPTPWQDPSRSEHERNEDFWDRQW